MRRIKIPHKVSMTCSRITEKGRQYSSTKTHTHTHTNNISSVKFNVDL